MIRAPHGRLLGFIDPRPDGPHLGRRLIYEDATAREYTRPFGVDRPPADCPVRSWTKNGLVHWTATVKQMEAHYGARLKRFCPKRPA